MGQQPFYPQMGQEYHQQQQQQGFGYAQPGYPFNQQQQLPQQGYPYQQQQPPFYEGFRDAGSFYSMGSMPPEPIPHPPPSTQLTLANGVRRQLPAPPQMPFQNGYPQHFYPGGIVHPQPPAPPLFVPPTLSVMAPSAAYSNSEENSDGANDDDSMPAAVAVRAPASQVSAPSTSGRSSALSNFRRSKEKAPSYPRETRYVPPMPVQLNANYYPKNTRKEYGYSEEQGSAHDHLELYQPASPKPKRSGVSLALSANFDFQGLRGKKSATARDSLTPPSTRRLSRRETGGSPGQSGNGESKGGFGSMIQQMDRMFSSIMTPTMFDSDRDSNGFSKRDGAFGKSLSVSSVSSYSGGGERNRVSTRRSSTTQIGLDGMPRTVFSRTERVVVNTDGTRKVEVGSFVRSFQCGC